MQYEAFYLQLKQLLQHYTNRRHLNRQRSSYMHYTYIHTLVLYNISLSNVGDEKKCVSELSKYSNVIKLFHTSSVVCGKYLHSFYYIFDTH